MQFQNSLGPYKDCKAERHSASQNPHLNDWTDSQSKPRAIRDDRLPPFIGLLVVCELVLGLSIAAAVIGLGYMIGLAIIEAVRLADWVRAAW